MTSVFRKIKEFLVKTSKKPWVILFVALFVATIIFIRFGEHIGQEFPKFLLGNGKSEDVYQEVYIYLLLLGTLAAIALCMIAYSQIEGVKKNMKMDLIRHLDDQWSSKEMTKIRAHLFSQYWPEKEKGYSAVRYYLKKCHSSSVNKQHNEDIHKKSVETYLEILNLLDIIGTVACARKEGIFNKNDVKLIFGGQVEKYLNFFGYKKGKNIYVFGENPEKHKKLQKHNAFDLFKLLKSHNE